MVASYIATGLSSMCMDYVSLAWLDSIPLITKGATASDYQGCVATQVCGITHCSICQCLNHQKSYNNLAV